jgi:hypothetical protein
MDIRSRTKIAKEQRCLEIDPEGCKGPARTVEPLEEEEEKEEEEQEQEQEQKKKKKKKTVKRRHKAYV